MLETSKYSDQQSFIEELVLYAKYCARHWLQSNEKCWGVLWESIIQLRRQVHVITKWYGFLYLKSINEPQAREVREEKAK